MAAPATLLDGRHLHWSCQHLGEQCAHASDVDAEQTPQLGRLGADASEKKIIVLALDTASVQDALLLDERGLVGAPGASSRMMRSRGRIATAMRR